MLLCLPILRTVLIIGTNPSWSLHIIFILIRLFIIWRRKHFLSQLSPSVLNLYSCFSPPRCSHNHRGIRYRLKKKQTSTARCVFQPGVRKGGHALIWGWATHTHAMLSLAAILSHVRTFRSEGSEMVIVCSTWGAHLAAPLISAANVASAAIKKAIGKDEYLNAL